MYFEKVIKSLITVVFCTGIVLSNSVKVNAILNYTLSDLEYSYENQDENRMELIKSKTGVKKNLISPISRNNTLAEWQYTNEAGGKNSVIKIMDDFSLVGKEKVTKKIGVIPAATITYDNHIYADIFEIDLPNCLSVGSNAFKNVESLTKVNMPVCEHLGAGAFNNCNELEIVNIPKCKAILDGTFEACGDLKSIEMPECESVGYRAFKDCDKLEEVYLPMCKKISTEAFRNCVSLKKLTVAKDCQFEEGAIARESKIPLQVLYLCGWSEEDGIPQEVTIEYVDENKEIKYERIVCYLFDKIQYVDENKEMADYEPDEINSLISEAQKPVVEEKRFLDKDEETGILVFADKGVLPNDAHVAICKLTPENIDNSDENYKKAIENLDEDKIKYIENIDLYSVTCSHHL